MSSDMDWNLALPSVSGADTRTDAISLKDISKRYRIGLKENIHDTMAGAMISFLKSPLSNYRKYRSLYRFDDLTGSHEADDVIWALKNVSFDVKEGEVIGIIGRNGAGKSTLLKVLSRITEPTSGYAAIRGRVSSLLEVGTGFHPELTGRENVYLNGTILGMKKREIDAKFDEIITFSGVEKFIDTPVKRYSSGMKLRLAFAVAAHLEPEILIVDEVLAVGDSDFQKKCVGKMYEMSNQGRTVLFVSHNMGAIMELCPTSILLKNGVVADKGLSKNVVEQYLASLFSPVDNMSLKDVRRKGDGRLQFTAVFLRNEEGQMTKLPISGQPLDVVINFESREDFDHVRFMFTIFNQMGIAVTHCNIMTSGNTCRVKKGEGQIICRIHRLPVPLGTYKIAVSASDDGSHELDLVSTACIFDVDTSSFFTAKYTPSMRYSTALVEHTWLMPSNGNLVK